ncbi:MAG TPA: ASPIC/UnbV domain-containing protein, partial [Planctomycetota bacterium]|nr:ASPIC/UnbV domain-containing protein [Planctomycetota bacterium]
NRSAIGARVLARYGGKTQAQSVLSQSSFYSCNDPRLHFGLGAAEVIDRIEVRWADGTKTVREKVAPRQILKLEPGS